MKKIFVTAVALTLTLGASAQGNNTGMGGDHEGCTSLAERVLKLEKKNDAFNVYINYAASFQETDNGTEWGSAFKNRQARLEFMGHLTDKISYRFRHRLNSGNNAQSEDNFAAATDVLWVGYQFNEKLGVHAGKVCQYWGGFEYDENPMYIYQFSDMGNNIDIFKAGVNVSYRPVATQELTLSITDAYSNKFAEEYGEGAYSLEADGTKRLLEASNHPLTYIFGWNGNFFGDKLQTRWCIAGCSSSDRNSTCHACSGISTTWAPSRASTVCALQAAREQRCWRMLTIPMQAQAISATSTTIRSSRSSTGSLCRSGT